MPCPYCAATATAEQPRRTARGYPTFRCNRCRRVFNERTGTPFNHLHYPTDLVLLVVLWRLRYTLRLRDRAEMFLDRGCVCSHEAVRAWAARFAPLLTDRLRAKRRGQAGIRWHADETYVRVHGRWCYLYRALDRDETAKSGCATLSALRVGKGKGGRVCRHVHAARGSECSRTGRMVRRSGIAAGPATAPSSVARARRSRGTVGRRRSSSWRCAGTYATASPPPTCVICYTQLLISPIPQPDPDRRWGGEVDAPSRPEAEAPAQRGCPFADRCPHVMQICRESPPPLFQTDEHRAVSCYLYRDAPVMPAGNINQVFRPRVAVSAARHATQAAETRPA